MRRRQRKSQIAGIITVFAVVTFIGLGIAERGTNDLLGSSTPYILYACLDGNDICVTVLGAHAKLPAMIALTEFHASPDALTLGPPGAATKIALQIQIPGSELTLARMKTLVAQATEAGFGASRVLYRWWGGRGD